MGTNYYLHVKPCKECGHPEKKFHLGKLSWGWTFSFHGIRNPWDDTPRIESYQDWLDYIRSCGDASVIKDECDEPISLDYLLQRIEAHRDFDANQTLFCRAHHPEHARQYCWLDDQGNSFQDCEFS